MCVFVFDLILFFEILTDMDRLALEKLLRWKVNDHLMKYIPGRRYLFFIMSFYLECSKILANYNLVMDL